MLLPHLQALVRDRNPYLAEEGHFFAQHYLREQLSQWGEVELHEFEVRGRSHQNLILDLPGTELQRPPIILGAHYDTVPGSPGADDNASGVATLLEIAKALCEQPARHPVRLIAFDMEEIGLSGSRAYVEALQANKEQVRLMLSLEMLGYCDSTPHSQQYPPGLKYFYPNRGDFIGLIGNWKTLPDLFSLSRSIRQDGNVPCQWLPAGARGLLVPDTRRSDHAPFWDAGYRAVLVTDTANLRNPHYHKASDRLETLDLQFLRCVCQGLIAGVRKL